MANLQSQIDILSKAVIREHIRLSSVEEKVGSGIEVTNNETDIYMYDSKGNKLEGTKEYEHESHKLTTDSGNYNIFTYDDDVEYTGFWLQDSDGTNYTINDKGEMKKCGTGTETSLNLYNIVRKINMIEGEKEKQGEKDNKRMVYIDYKLIDIMSNGNTYQLIYNKDTLETIDSDNNEWKNCYYVTITDNGNTYQLIYNKDTLKITYSSNSTWLDQYYVVILDKIGDEDKEVTLMVNPDFNNIEYSSKDGYNITCIKDESETIRGFNITNSDSKILYAYRDSLVYGEFDDDKSGNIKKVHLTSNVKDITDYAFSHCESLTSITIPNSVKEIGEYAFLDCQALISVTIPDSVKKITNCAFYHCINLKSVTIPDSVEIIGVYAFLDCQALTSVTIPNSVTSIGEEAFWNCISLKRVIIYGNITNIGKEAFANCHTDLTFYTDRETTRTTLENYGIASDKILRISQLPSQP